MLGSLAIGARFIKDEKEWEVRQQNWSRDRPVNKGKAVCRQVNSPVVICISRDNYVIPV